MRQTGPMYSAGDTLKLRGTTPLARGRSRDVYVHPHLRDLLVKVVTAGPVETGPVKAVIRRWRPQSAFRLLTSEVECDTRLMLRAAGDDEIPPVVKMWGLVRTDLGPGSLCERVCDADGALAPTLQAIADRGALAPLLPDLTILARRLFDLRIVAHDLHADNVVYGRRAGLDAFCLIDGFGERNAIPLCSMSRRMNDRALNRKIGGLAERLGLEWDARARALG